MRKKLPTKKEKAIAVKLLDELVVLARFMDTAPKPRNKNDRRWSEGMVFGIKYAVKTISAMQGDPKIEELYEKRTEWEKEEKRLFGTNQYKELQKSRKRQIIKAEK